MVKAELIMCSYRLRPFGQLLCLALGGMACLQPAGALALEYRASQPCYAWAAAALAEILAMAPLAAWESPCACLWLPALLPAGWRPLGQASAALATAEEAQRAHIPANFSLFSPGAKHFAKIGRAHV